MHERKRERVVWADQTRRAKAGRSALPRSKEQKEREKDVNRGERLEAEKERL